MPLPIYTELLVQAPGLALDTAYTYHNFGPNVWVIRTIDAFLAGPGGGYIQAWDNSGCTFWFNAQTSDSTGLWLQYSGYRVIQAGGTVTFKGTVVDPFGHIDVSATGYSLSPP